MADKKKATIAGHSFAVIDILKEEKVKKFAEIGVLKSENAKRILKHISIFDLDLEEYWAVDPWDIGHAVSKKERRRTEESWFRMHHFCCRNMILFPQLRVIKMTSEQASTVFPDGYFDMVYIDANHRFKHVYADIGYWLPKVRKGGLIGGHDYGNSSWKGIKEAVDKWFGEENIKVWELEEIWIKRV